MADTSMGDFDSPCDDCGTTEGVCIQHWGFLVPAGETGIFCRSCMTARSTEVNNGKVPPEIGWRKNKKEEGENND